MGPLQADGYEFVIHMRAEDGTDVRVVLERSEADQLQSFIAAELSKQRERIKSLCQVYAALSEEPAQC